MRFEVKTELSKEDFTAFYRLNQKVHARVATLLLKILGIAAYALGLVLTVQMVVFRLWESGDVFWPYCVFILMLAVWPLVDRFMISQLFKANGSMLKGEYRFHDEEVLTGADHMSGRYAYSAFRELYHTRDAYYLYIDKGHAVILPERCFTQGDPAAFGRFIAEKTGLEVKEIK